MKSGLTPAFRMLKLTYGTYLKRRYHMKGEGIEKVIPYKGPAIVFGNHTHTLDPFFISALYPYTIRWVAGSYLFKMKGVSFLLRHLVRAIPKIQGRSDLETIRSISAALKKGDIVGLFPEGTRSWDGEMMDITAATAKLVRIFKVPVIFVHIEGGFLNKPRWSDTERKGPVSIKVTEVLTPERIASMSLPEITKVVEDNLTFSTDKWEEQARIPYPSDKGAERIERLFYMCPSCHAISTMESSGNTVRCTKCSYSADLDEYGRIHTTRGEFTKLSEWHEWEKGELSKLIDEKDGELFSDHCILFQTPGKKKLEDVSTSFSVSATRNELTFVFPSAVNIRGNVTDKLVIPVSSIESLVINAKQTIEFYSDGKQYRFRVDENRSPLKYQELWLLVRERSIE